MATLSGNKIKDTYQSLIKLTDNGNLTTGAKQLTDGFGNNSPLYLSTTQIGIGVTPEATYDLHIYSNAKVGGNLTVTGDLTVEGTTTTIDTQTLTVEDPLIEVASNNTSTDAVDIGWYGKYAPSGTTLYAGLFRDTGDSKFKLFRNLEEQPTTTVNTSGTGYTVATLVADVEGTLTGTIASSTVATTQSANDNSTKVATTAYVDASIGNSTLAEVLVNGNTTSGTDIAVSSGDDITFVDDSKAIFGTDSDLEIYHYSITDTATISINGELDIRANTLQLRNYSGETYLRASSNGAVRLYYDAVEKFITTSTGISVTDTVTATTFSGQLDGTISSTTTATTQTQGDNSTKVATTAYVDSAIGGQDTLAEILANGNTTGGTDIAVSSGDSITFAGSGGTSTVINHSTYDTRIINDNSLGSIILRSADTVMQNAAGTETIAHFYENGAVELYYDNSKKLETTSTGVTVTGDVDVVSSGSVNIGDSSEGTDARLSLGASNDFLLYHFGENYIQSTGADLNINAGTQDVNITANAVGIGTTSPDTILEIASGNSGGDAALDAPVFRINNTTESADWDIGDVVGSIEYYTSDASGNAPYVTSFIKSVNETGNGTLPDGALTFGTATYNASGGAVERMRIDSSGRVGIGGSPSYKLDVQDTNDPAQIRLKQSGNTSGLIIKNYAGSESQFVNVDNGPMVFKTNDTERMRITSDGHTKIADEKILGLRTSSNDYAIQYRDLDFRFIGSADGTTQRKFSFGYYTSDNPAGTWNGQVYINSYTGAVGIGTSSPNEKLVIGTTGGTQNIEISNSYIQSFNRSGSAGYQTLNFYASSYAFNVGNVGIGTSGVASKVAIKQSGANWYEGIRLFASSNSHWTGFGNTGSVAVIASSYDSTGSFTPLAFYTSDTERMRIDSSGNILVGKTSSTGVATGNIEVSNSSSASVQIEGGSHEWSMLVSSSVDALRFYQDSTEYMRIDSSGNVGINETNPQYGKLQIKTGSAIGYTSTSFISGTNLRLTTGGTAATNVTTGVSFGIGGAAEAYIGAVQNSSAYADVVFQTYHGAYGERMRMTSAGNVLMNCTSVPSGSGGGAAFETSGTLMRLKQSSPTTSTTKLQIYYNANGEVGSIHTSGSATAFNTSSDYRLKDDYKDFNGLNLVDNINVYDFEWKSDKTRSYGVKAHELQEVIPQAVNGEKDGKDMQQVDYSKLVPILLKSIQELKARIEILENN